MIVIPGTLDWVLDRLDLRAQRELRRVLRRYEREFDARLVALFAARPTAERGQLVEFHGDDAVVPRPFPEQATSIPSHDMVRCADGDDHAAVVQRVRLGRELPSFGLVAIDCGIDGPGALAIAEECSETLEDVLVAAIA